MPRQYTWPHDTGHVQTDTIRYTWPYDPSEEMAERRKHEIMGARTGTQTHANKKQHTTHHLAAEEAKREVAATPPLEPEKGYRLQAIRLGLHDLAT